MATSLSGRALLAAGAAFAALAAASAAQAASLTLGTTNTSNAPTTLTGNTAGGPELKVVNTNASQPAFFAQGTGAAAGAFGVLGMLTATSPSADSAAVRGQSNATNGRGYGVWGTHAGSGIGVYGTAPTGIGVYGKHTGGGTAAAVRGDSASGAASAVAVYGLLTPASAGAGSAAVRGENKGTNANGYGVWGSQAGSGIGVRGESPFGTGVLGIHGASSGAAAAVEGVNSSEDSGAAGVLGRIPSYLATGESAGVLGTSVATFGVMGRVGSGSGFHPPEFTAGVWGDSNGVVGVLGTSFQDVGVLGRSTGGRGVSGVSVTQDGVVGSASASDRAGVLGVNGTSGGYGVHGFSTQGIGVRGESDYRGVFGSSVGGIGVRGDSTDFQGVSGSSVHNAGVYGETTGNGFAAYFVGPTEQHGRLNTYDAQVRVAHGGGALSETSAAVQAEQEGSSGEAGWLRVSDPSNTNAVLMLIKQSAGTGDFLKCYDQSGPGSYTQKCHVNSAGTFVSGSDFAESLPVRGGRAGYEPGDVLTISRTHARQVTMSTRPRDPALIGVYSTRPGVLGADDGHGITRVGKDQIPVAITGVVPVKVTAQNGPIRPGDFLTSSSSPGRAMKAGKHPALGTVLGKSLGFLRRGQGKITMLVMQR